MGNYPGGKNGAGVYQTIINQMPPHDIYVEGFLGGGAVMNMKRKAQNNIGVDVDRQVIQMWNAREPRSPFMHFYEMSFIDWQTTCFYWVTPETLIYLDPPYLFSTRKSKGPLYRCEFGEEEQHYELLKLITTLDCMVMISGYWSELYARELRDWRAISFKAMTRGGTMATEWLWMNYPEPIELHDYRYLGNGFRQRESIKRQQNRWRKKLHAMSAVKRYAMLSVLAELKAEASAQPAMPPAPSPETA